MVDFLFALIEVFSLLGHYSSGVMRRNVYSWAVSTGVDLFALKFYWIKSSPINIVGVEKTRDIGLPDGEDRIPLHSLVLANTGV